MKKKWRIPRGELLSSRRTQEQNSQSPEIRFESKGTKV